MNKNSYFEITRTLIAILIALFIAVIIVLSVSKEPLTALNLFVFGPINSLRHFGNVVEMAIPLIFAGLAISLVFQVNMFNMAIEGSFFIGAIVASAIAIYIKLPIIIHPIIAIIAAGLVGAIICFVPAIMKTKWNADVLVSSLMFNYILTYLGLYAVNKFIKDPNAGALVSYKFMKTAKLVKIIPKTRIHFGIFIAIAVVILCIIYIYRTRWGYEIKITGLNEKFANYSGIKIAKVYLYTQLIAGVIAGIGGATEILGMYTRFEWQTTPGYGWDGCIVAILAKNRPELVPLAAFLLAYIRIGADLMARMSDVQNEVVSIIQGIMIMLITAESFLAYWNNKKIYKKAKLQNKEVHAL